ncbi:MAG: hypothetical protein K5891_08460 [Lachnospiraceae bacterium]|nr:hypothetical protein [Lachnospiraceae bacterium]
MKKPALFSSEKFIFALKCLAVAAIMCIINFFFKGDVESLTRATLSEMYTDGPIDVLFIGASHTYRSYDPAAIEAATGLNVYNAGSALQQMQGSYYLLQEAAENSDIDTVVLDITYTMQLLEGTGERQTVILTDYMKNPLRRVIYAGSVLGPEGITGTIWPCLHNGVFNQENLRHHLTGDYKKDYASIVFAEEGYHGQGYVPDYLTVPEDFTFTRATEINPAHPISDFTMKYLKKVIAYCKKHGLRLILADPPMPDGTLVTAGHFQEYIDAVGGIAEENDLEYWEFNLAKDGLLDLDRGDFYDETHLNIYGAEKFSALVSDILASGNTDIFYDSYAEKLEKNPDGTLE